MYVDGKKKNYIGIKYMYMNEVILSLSLSAIPILSYVLHITQMFFFKRH